MVAAATTKLLDLVVIWWKHILERRRERARRRDAVYRPYLHLLSSLPSKLWDATVAGFDGYKVIDDIGRERERLRAEVLLDASRAVRRALAKVEALLPTFVDRVGDLRQKEQNAREMLQIAFNETMWLALEQLAAQMSKEIDRQ